MQCMVEEFDEELGSLVDNFRKKVEDENRGKEGKEKESQEFKSAFIDFSKTVIKPEMDRMVDYLKSKNQSCSVGMTEFYSRYDKSSVPDISFNIYPPLTLGTHRPENTMIRFFPNLENKIGMRIAGLMGTYDPKELSGEYTKEEITTELLKDKLIKFTKACYEHWDNYTNPYRLPKS